MDQYFITFYKGIMFHSFIIWIYHLLFIHSSTAGELGRICLLAIVNSAAVSCVPIYLFASLFSVLWGYVVVTYSNSAMLCFSDIFCEAPRQRGEMQGFLQGQALSSATYWLSEELGFSAPLVSLL